MKFCKLIKLQHRHNIHFNHSISPPPAQTAKGNLFFFPQSKLKEIRVKELAINYKGEINPKEREKNEL